MADMHMLSCQNEMIKFQQYIVKIKGKKPTTQEGWPNVPLILLLKQKWQSFCPNELHLCEKRASTYFLRGVGGAQWSGHQRNHIANLFFCCGPNQIKGETSEQGWSVQKVCAKGTRF